jgi:antitoxin HicB
LFVITQGKSHIVLYSEIQKGVSHVSQIYKLPLVLEPQSEGGYVVTCPLLPELITEGEDVHEAIQNANDALAAIVEAFMDLKRPLPSALQPAREGAPLWIETVLAV